MKVIWTEPINTIDCQETTASKKDGTTSANFKYFKDTTLNSYLQEIGRARERLERDFFEAGGKVGYDITKINKITGWLPISKRQL